MSTTNAWSKKFQLFQKNSVPSLSKTRTRKDYPVAPEKTNGTKGKPKKSAPKKDGKRGKGRQAVYARPDLKADASSDADENGEDCESLHDDSERSDESSAGSSMEKFIADNGDLVSRKVSAELRALMRGIKRKRGAQTAKNEDEQEQEATGDDSADSDYVPRLKRAKPDDTDPPKPVKAIVIEDESSPRGNPDAEPNLIDTTKQCARRLKPHQQAADLERHKYYVDVRKLCESLEKLLQGDDGHPTETFSMFDPVLHELQLAVTHLPYIFAQTGVRAICLLGKYAAVKTRAIQYILDRVSVHTMEAPTELPPGYLDLEIRPAKYVMDVRLHHSRVNMDVERLCCISPRKLKQHIIACNLRRRERSQVHVIVIAHELLQTQRHGPWLCEMLSTGMIDDERKWTLNAETNTKEVPYYKVMGMLAIVINDHHVDALNDIVKQFPEVQSSLDPLLTVLAKNAALRSKMQHEVIGCNNVCHGTRDGFFLPLFDLGTVFPFFPPREIDIHFMISGLVEEAIENINKSLGSPAMMLRLCQDKSGHRVYSLFVSLYQEHKECSMIVPLIRRVMMRVWQHANAHCLDDQFCSWHMGINSAEDLDTVCVRMHLACKTTGHSHSEIEVTVPMV